MAQLAILVSKQVDIILDHGGETPEESAFILQAYDYIRDAIESKTWSSISSNSVTLTAAFGLKHYPPSDDYNPENVCRYLWQATHVVAFWAGGPNFQDVLEATARLKRKLRLFLCNIKTLQIERISTKELHQQP